MNRKSIKQTIKLIGIIVIVLVGIFVIYAKLKSPYQKQNAGFYVTKFENYMSGSLVAFCNWASNGTDKEYTYGRCTFKSFYAIL